MLKIIKRVPIRTGIFWTGFILVLSFLLVLSGIFYLTAYRICVDRTNESIVSSLNEKNVQIDNILNKCFAIGHSIANDNQLQRRITGYKDMSIIEQLDTEQYVSHLFDPYFMNNIEIHDIVLILEGKRFSESGMGDVIPLEQVAQEEWFRSIGSASEILLPDVIVRRGRVLSIVDSDSDLVAPNPQLTLFFTIYSDNNDTLGYLCIGISKHYLYNNLISPAKSFDSSVIFVTDNNGNTIISEDSQPLTGLSVLPEAVEKKSSGSLTDTYKGQRSLVTYSTMSNQGWKIVEITPRSRAYSFTRTILLFNLAALLLFIVIALILNRKLAKVITAPIVELAGNITELRRSGSKGEICENEIGILSSNYDKLLDRIDTLIEEARRYEMQKRQSELEAMKTKIMALESQINPHFLYNTLYSISWKAIDRGVPEIGKVLSNLGSLYKSNMYRGKDFCTVEEELSQLQLYIDLQEACYSKAFRYTIDIPPNLLQLTMPRFILQPFIENIFIHAFKQTAEECHFSLTIHADELLHIIIADNGAGINAGAIADFNAGRFTAAGVGIRNIAERITLLCGEEYGITFSQNKPVGTVAHIKLPIITEESKDVQDFSDR